MKKVSQIIKRILCVVLALVITSSTMTCPVFAASSTSEIEARLNQIITLPDCAPGKQNPKNYCLQFVNKVSMQLFGVMPPNSPDGYKLNGISSYWYLVDTVHDANATNANVANLLKRAQAGDVIQFRCQEASWQHTAMVYSTNANGITIYDSAPPEGASYQTVRKYTCSWNQIAAGFWTYPAGLGTFEDKNTGYGHTGYGLSLYRCNRNVSTATISSNNQVTSSGSDSSTSFGIATTGVADTITQTSAILRGSVSASSTRAVECGMYFGTSAAKLTKLGSDPINTYGTTMYYSTDKYIKQDALEPNTTYYYQAYVIVNKQEYKGDVKSFKTLPASTLTLSPTPNPSPTPAPTPAPTQDLARGIAFPTVAVGSITSTSAHVASTCSYTDIRPSSVGVYLGTSTSNMTKRGSDTINHSKNPFDIWYDLSGLTAGTTYYYKFYAIVDGVEIVSGTKNFTTTDPTAIDLSGYKMSGITASDITANSVRLSATCSYTSVRPSSVGVYLGTTPSNMTVKGSDNNITHNKNPFDIWYNLSGLSAGTTYYYRFYTIVSGKTLLSDIKTFTTDNVDIEIDPLPNPIGTPGPSSNFYQAITDANGAKTSVYDSVDTNNRHQLCSLAFGTPIIVYPDTEVKSGSYQWVKIYYNGTIGYVNSNFVKKVTPVSLNTTEPYYATSKTQQSAHGDPLVGFYINGTLKSGDTVLVNPQKQAYSIGSYTWVYVQSDSVSGYVNLDLLKKTT